MTNIKEIESSVTADSEEIQGCRKNLLRFLIWMEDGRSSEKLARLKEQVAELSPLIHTALERGMTFAQIVGLLQGQGLEIDGDTLRDLYYGYRNQTHKERMEQRMEAWCETLLKKIRNEREK